LSLRRYATWRVGTCAVTAHRGDRRQKRGGMYGYLVVNGRRPTPEKVTAAVSVHWMWFVLRMDAEMLGYLDHDCRRTGDQESAGTARLSGLPTDSLLGTRRVSAITKQVAFNYCLLLLDNSRF